MIELFSVFTLRVSSFKTINKVKKWTKLKTELDLIGNEKFLIAQINSAKLY